MCATRRRYPECEREAYSDSSLAIRFGEAALSEALTSAGLDPEQDQIGVVLVVTHGERQLPRPGRTDPTLAGVRDVVSAMQSLSRARRAQLRLRGVRERRPCRRLWHEADPGRTCRRRGSSAGADSMLREPDFFAFCALYAMTMRDCPPAEACCPFDARRDGFLMAEGAGFVVLESERHARKRDARPLAIVKGFGAAQNAYHSVASPPDAGGPRLAITRALDDAQLPASAIEYINAHGTSTRDNDWCETLAIRKAFGSAADTTPVSSSKGVLGHTMAPAGTIETILCVKALRDGVMPPTANYAAADPDCDLDYNPEHRPRA